MWRYKFISQNSLQGMIFIPPSLMAFLKNIYPWLGLHMFGREVKMSKNFWVSTRAEILSAWISICQISTNRSCIFCAICGRTLLSPNARSWCPGYPAASSQEAALHQVGATPMQVRRNGCPAWGHTCEIANCVGKTAYCDGQHRLGHMLYVTKTCPWISRVKKTILLPEIKLVTASWTKKFSGAW